MQWHDVESVNTQETTLRRDATGVEKTAPDEGFTATRGGPRDSELLEDIDKGNFPQSERVGFTEEALEQADRAEPRQRDTSKEFSASFWRPQDSSCCDSG